MAKSKHPRLLPKALADIADLNGDRKKNATFLKKLKSLCGGTIATSDATIKNTDAQYKYLQDVIDRYARKVVEIETEEEKSSPDKRALTRLEKEADKLRKEYNDGVRVLSDLSITMYEQMTKIGNLLQSGGYTTFNVR